MVHARTNIGEMMKLRRNVLELKEKIYYGHSKEINTGEIPKAEDNSKESPCR